MLTGIAVGMALAEFPIYWVPQRVGSDSVVRVVPF
jgi:hypothetical protein